MSAGVHWLRRLGRRIAGRARRDVRRLLGRPEPRPFSMLYVIPCSAAPTVPLPQGAHVAYVDAETVRAAPERYSANAADAIVSLAHGHRCLVTLVDGELAYRTWVADAAPVRSAYPPGTLPDEAVWVYAGMTLPRFRGRGLHAASLGWLAAQGRAVAVQAVSGNGTAQRSFMRAGARFIGTQAIFD